MDTARTARASTLARVASAAFAARWRCLAAATTASSAACPSSTAAMVSTSFIARAHRSSLAAAAFFASPSCSVMPSTRSARRVKRAYARLHATTCAALGPTLKLGAAPRPTPSLSRTKHRCGTQCGTAKGPLGRRRGGVGTLFAASIHRRRPAGPFSPGLSALEAITSLEAYASGASAAAASASAASLDASSLVFGSAEHRKVKHACVSSDSSTCAAARRAAASASRLKKGREGIYRSSLDALREGHKSPKR
eukprot:1192031-Prorocentrum_minimum.AAC.1